MEYLYTDEIKENLKKHKDIFQFYKLKLRKYKGKNKNMYRFCLIKVDETQCLILRKKDNINPFKLFEIIEQILTEENYYKNKLSKNMCFKEEKMWKGLT